MYRLIASIVLLLGLLGTIWAEHVDIKSLKADNLVLATQIKSVQIDLDNCTQKFKSLSDEVSTQNNAVNQLSTDKKKLEDKIKNTSIIITKLQTDSNNKVNDILNQNVDKSCDNSLSWLATETLRIIKSTSN